MPARIVTVAPPAAVLDRLRVLLLGELGSVHLRRWAGALGAEVELHVAGFGDLGPTGSCTVHHLGDTRVGGDRRFLPAVPAVAALVRRLRPDVVHAHYVASYGVVAALATAGGRSVPVVHSAWGSDVLGRAGTPWWHRQAADRALRGGAAVTYDSDDVGEVLAGLAPHVPRHRVLFGPPAAWTTAPRQDGTTILSPRLPLELYRPEVQLRAFAAMAGDAPGWDLEVLSSGHDVTGLERLGAELGLAARIRFRPVLDRSRMLEAYLRSPVMISIPRSDATAASLLEAMATGSFPIVSDLPANRHMVTDGVNGLVVGVGDVAATAAALRRAIADEPLRARAAAANRDRVRLEATWEASIDQVVGLYRAVARGVSRS